MTKHQRNSNNQAPMRNKSCVGKNGRVMSWRGLGFARVGWVPGQRPALRLAGRRAAPKYIFGASDTFEVPFFDILIYEMRDGEAAYENVQDPKSAQSPNDECAAVVGFVRFRSFRRLPTGDTADCQSA